MAAPALHLAWANPVCIQWGAGCFQQLSAPSPVVVLADRAALSDENETLLLVPTTAGTGSEVTRWATLWDTDIATPTKLSWAPADGYAEQAWVDPELSHSCPQRQSRDCALDSLARVFGVPASEGAQCLRRRVCHAGAGNAVCPRKEFHCKPITQPTARAM